MHRIVFPIAAGFFATAVLAAEPARPLIPEYNATTLTQACTDMLAKAGAQVSALEVLPLDKVASTDLLGQIDQIDITVEDVQGPADLLANVSPDEKTRAAGEDCLQRAGVFQTDLQQNLAVYERIKATRPETAAGKKFRQDLIDQFEDTGVALSPDKRERVKAIRERLEVIRQEFDRNIRDNKTRMVFTPDELKGLPADYVARAKRDDKGNYLLSFEYPDYEPFMANADNEEARHQYQIAFYNRGTPLNLELLSEAMRLRKEMAGLFGLPSYADFAIRRRMAATPAAVDKFLGDVKDAVRELEQKEIAELAALKAQTLHKNVADVKLYRWDADYYQNKFKKAKYDVDQEALRKYFPTEASVQWVLAMSGKLYGVRFEPVKVPVWSDDVRYFDVVDTATDKRIAGIYLDLFPREGKFGHAAAWPVRASSTNVGRTPISALVTNLNRAGLNQEELETLVHEFGHTLHGVLSNTAYASQGGTSVELDFVEAPSQMYEEWARRKESLALLPQFCKPACPVIDDKMLRRLSDARLYGAGTLYARQWLYASYDMATSAPTVGDPLAIWIKLESDTPLGYVPNTQNAGTFSHIIGGYTAGYYGYMWSEVLALDMLSAYGGNLMDPAVGKRFRTMILAQGSQRQAKDMVHDFLGRDPSSAAFIAEITGKRSTAMVSDASH